MFYTKEKESQDVLGKAWCGEVEGGASAGHAEPPLPPEGPATLGIEYGLEFT